MSEFKTGDRVLMSIDSETYYRIHDGKLGTITRVFPDLPYPVDVKLDDGTEMAVNYDEIQLARPTAKDEIENMKAQIKSILSAAQDGGGVPLAEARAKGIIEGLDAALAFIYEESLPEDERKALDAIDGGTEPW